MHRWSVGSLLCLFLFAKPFAVQSRGDAEEVLALEQKIEAAVVRGDVAFADSVLSPDFHFRHGDGWVRGEKTGGMEDDKAAFLKRIADKEYLVHDLDNSYAAHDFDSVKVEMHRDVAITFGRYIGNIPGSGEGRAWFAVWYEKIYARRDGGWMYLSHRTVHGATYGVDRQSVSDK